MRENPYPPPTTNDASTWRAEEIRSWAATYLERTGLPGTPDELAFTLGPWLCDPRGRELGSTSRLVEAVDEIAQRLGREAPDILPSYPTATLRELAGERWVHQLAYACCAVIGGRRGLRLDPISDDDESEIENALDRFGVLLAGSPPPILPRPTHAWKDAERGATDAVRNAQQPVAPAPAAHDAAPTPTAIVSSPNTPPSRPFQCPPFNKVPDTGERDTSPPHDARSFHRYAADWLTEVEGVTDPAGALWLADALSRFAPVGAHRSDVLRAIVDATWHTADARVEAMRAASELFPHTDRHYDDCAALIWSLRAPGNRPKRQYPVIPSAVIEPIIQAKLEVSEHRLLRWFVGQLWLLGCRGATGAEAARVVVRGGWSALAEQLEISSKDGITMLSRGGERLNTLRLQTPLGEEQLLNVERVRTPGRGPYELLFEAGPPLRADYVYRLRDANHRDRYLVPLRPDLPPLPRRRNAHAAACSYEMLVMREMRHSLRRDDRGRVVAHLSASRLARAAKLAELTPANRRAVESIWRSDWLVHDGEVYRLAGSAALMLPQLEAGIRMSERGRSARKARPEPPKGKKRGRARRPRSATRSR